jgi:hypothetical protein
LKARTKPKEGWFMKVGRNEPCPEMLDDWMQEGYDQLDDGHRAAACDVWWRVLEVLRGRLLPDMRTTE